MISKFFVNRPKFAFVISIVLTIMGLIAIPVLPVAEFPEIAPPQVAVSTSYPGANAVVVQDTIAKIIESEVNGVEDMIYMSSKSANDGSYSLTVTFEVGTDADMAQVNVQNRVQQAMPKLPEEVARQGIKVNKKSSSMLMIINLVTEKDKFDSLFLTNYAGINIVDNLTRVTGVSEVSVIGAMDYAIRVWLNPDRMAALNITTSDVSNSLREQNIQVAAGRIGAAPVPRDQQFQYTLSTQGRLSSVKEFEQVILRTNRDGSTVSLGDIARIELGSQTYDAEGKLNNEPSALLAIYQMSDANALDVADGIYQEMDRLSQAFPDGMDYKILYDTTEFVKTSINEVVTTLFISVALVVLVVFIFLQDVRSTLIPAIAIPVSLIGTFVFLLAADMTINTVSLFALILAIGIVVDDAILVVENVSRIMAEEGLPAPEATIKAMAEVSGPIIATTLVLLAVFAPTAVMPGITGQMYAQFSVTICISVIISSINALTLSPALCASLLKAPKQKNTGFHGLFNKYFGILTEKYTGLVRQVLGKFLLVGICYLAIIGCTAWLGSSLPTGFVPQEDKKAFMVDVQLPDGSSINRTDEVMEEMVNMVLSEPGVENVIHASGFSILTNAIASNAGLIVVSLSEWEERLDPNMHEQQILRRVQAKLNTIAEARAVGFSLPPISGVGNVGGVEFVLQDLQGRGAAELSNVMTGFIMAANAQPEIGVAFSNFRADVPQLYVDVDRRKAKVQGVPLSEIFGTLSTFLGSAYVNDFNLFGKVFRVMTQAEAEFRDDPRDIQRFYVRTGNGEMVPLSTLVQVQPKLGPEVLDQYNLYPSVTINALPAPGYSSGEAIQALSRAAAESLPSGYSFEWTGQTYQELKAGNLAMVIFALAIVFTYLFLVAQYESWTIPLAVMLAVPLAVMGAFLNVWFASSDVNLYTQIGLVLLIGLASKNAILIVEFAKVLRENDKLPILEAAAKAARLRFRAVLMTAISFIFGIFPLVVAVGAGASSRNSLGYAVFGGMLVATLVGTLIVPVFFAMLQTMREKVKGNTSTESA
ncbi:multidrug efflux RND transporter permease subunit [Neiella sp. HB171785]|uniref:Efflux pump membrane transporter n=1 Tax=Neiella litorisoli TaxID=2771431 RepID=A0A8J6QLK6_9GAMM|nr:multidrug efflux RND transporter permease subunit [Neiella litorisoli]MBD1390447.1 multidrug efflux RND transporter permease subunit [Neiella litorisoli]